MNFLVNEFLQKAFDYSDLLEDTEWGVDMRTTISIESYSDLKEDTDWL